jgi:hypothetical protein
MFSVVSKNEVSLTERAAGKALQSIHAAGVILDNCDYLFVFGFRFG